MQFSVVIPDRGDRPKLLANCLRMMKSQTVQPEEIVVVDFAPTDGEKDITKRYRKGYDRLRGKGLDLIAFIENDDYYSPDYFETVLNEYAKGEAYDIFGLDRTTYYHIGVKKWFYMHHYTRSSAMSTFIKPDLPIMWGLDHDPYTDLYLWSQLENSKTFRPNKLICIGIKHAVGLCGGANHFDQMHRYINDDFSLDLLRENMDAESFKFYTTL